MYTTSSNEHVPYDKCLRIDTAWLLYCIGVRATGEWEKLIVCSPSIFFDSTPRHNPPGTSMLTQGQLILLPHYLDQLVVRVGTDRLSAW